MAARDAFEDMLELLEWSDGDMSRARRDILDLLAGLQAEAIEAATGPQRPVDEIRPSASTTIPSPTR